MTIVEKIAKLEKELAEIKEEAKQEKQITRFKPKDGQRYLAVLASGQVDNNLWDDGWCSSLIAHNNIFRLSSEDNLKKYAHNVIRVQNRLMQLHEELCPSFWPAVPQLNKCYVVYDLSDKKWTFSSYDIYDVCVVPFTAQAAIKAAEILNAEKFMMEDENNDT